MCGLICHFHSYETDTSTHTCFKLSSTIIIEYPSWYQYIKIFVVRPSVCVCVTDVGVATTNLRFVCKTIMCVSAFTEMAIIFLEIVKAVAGLDTLRCRLREGCHCGRLPLH